MDRLTNRLLVLVLPILGLAILGRGVAPHLAGREASKPLVALPTGLAGDATPLAEQVDRVTTKIERLPAVELPEKLGPAENPGSSTFRARPDVPIAWLPEMLEGGLRGLGPTADSTLRPVATSPRAMLRLPPDHEDLADDGDAAQQQDSAEESLSETLEQKVVTGEPNLKQPPSRRLRLTEENPDLVETSETAAATPDWSSDGITKVTPGPLALTKPDGSATSEDAATSKASPSLPPVHPETAAGSASVDAQQKDQGHDEDQQHQVGLEAAAPAESRRSKLVQIEQDNERAKQRTGDQGSTTPPPSRSPVTSPPIASLPHDDDYSDVGAAIERRGRPETQAAELDSQIVESDSLPTDASARWSPIDLRNLEISKAPPRHFERRRSVATQASPSDTLLAQDALRLGFDLARRRAFYSARARFVEALRIVSRSLDEQSASTEHATALRRGLAAFHEAADFFPRSNKPDQDVNLRSVAAGHETPIFNHVDTAGLTPEQGLREYLSFAEQELARGLGHDPIAAQALYGLGRLQTHPEANAAAPGHVQARRAITLYQAALIIDSRNYSAANELGVLLARHGQFEQAVRALRHCVALSPQATAWKNLAAVHEQMGQREQARLARREASTAASSSQRGMSVAPGPSVQWVDAEAFASMPSSDVAPTWPAGNAAPPADADRPAQSQARRAPSQAKSPWSWLRRASSQR